MSADTDDSGPNWLKWGGIALAVVALFVAYSFLPVQEWSKAFKEWIEGFGALGWIIFAAIYAFATLFLIPGSFLTLAAGLAYGLWGFPIVIVGATAGAAMAFLAGRYLVQERVQKAIENRDKFKAIDAAIEEDGWKVVGLLRLSPAIPFSLQNWLFGATSVAFWPYLIATFFGIMPGTMLFIWIGSLGGSAAGGEGSALKYVFFGVGLVATLVVTILVGRKAKAKLAEHGLKEEET